MKKIQATADAIKRLIDGNPRYGEDIKQMFKLLVRARSIEPDKYLGYALDQITDFERRVVAQGGISEAEVTELTVQLSKHAILLLWAAREVGAGRQIVSCERETGCMTQYLDPAFANIEARKKYAAKKEGGNCERGD